VIYFQVIIIYQLEEDHLSTIKIIRKTYSEFNEIDYQAIMEICDKVFDHGDHVFINELIRKSPFGEKNTAFLAYDGDRLIGCVHLIDTPMDYFGLELKSCELGIVATDPDYQKRGISSQLTEQFMNEVKEKGYTSIFIQGIPHFYRKFGFNYAVPMHSAKFTFHNGMVLKQIDHQIHEAKAEDANFIYEKCLEFRKQKSGIYRYRPQKLIKHSINDYETPELKKLYYIVSENGEKKGYFCLKNDPNHVNLEEISEMTPELFASVYSFLQEKAGEQNEILLNVPKNISFIDYLESMSELKKGDFDKTIGLLEKDIGEYAWQVLIPDYFRFFQAIRPVLEDNIAHSEFKDRDIQFNFNTYKELIAFDIRHSKIDLKYKPWTLTWDMNLPPQTAVKIIFDNFTQEELRPVIPDLIIKHQELKQLLKVLFPKHPVHFFGGY